MADNKEVLGLDLDVTDFKEGISVAKEGLSSLTEGTNLQELGNLIAAAGTGLGLVAVAALALKTTFDLVFEGDQIKRTNDLFGNLTTNFGLAGDELKNNLLKAAGGMADTTSVIDAANKAMIGLGQNSAMIPQIMEVARKTTLAFGGDLTERFQQLSMAITTGNERMLRTNGIFIDSKKALQDFAVSIGATTNELNEAGRQQAIFNAVMAYSATNLKAVNTETQNSTTAWVQFKTEVKEAADGIALAFNKTFGPTVTSMIKGFASILREVGLNLKSYFGSGAEKAAADLELLKDKIESTKVIIDQMKKGPGGILDKAAIDAETKSLQSMEAELRKQQGLDDEIARKKSSQHVQSMSAIDQEKKAGNDRFIDKQKQAADEIKLQEEVVKIQQQDAANSVKLANSESALNTARLQRQQAEYQRYALEIRKIDQQLANGEIANRKIADQKKVALAKGLNNELKKEDKDYAAEHKQMLQNQLDESQTVFDGIANAAKKAAGNATADIQNFGKQGEIVTSTFQKEGTASFEAFGKAAVDHSQSASEIMKGFFLNALADMAQAEGELFLVAGLADPSKLAAGAALLALSGALRAMASSTGAGSSSSSLGSYGGGSSAGGGTSSAADSTSPAAAAATPTGSLTINIQGDYLNTQETQRTLLQAVRDATDQTGFQYLQIGQTGAQT